MNPKAPFRLALYLTLLNSGQALAAQEFVFVRLGDLPGGSFRSGGEKISADARVVIGISSSGQDPSDFEAFRWTTETGMVGLGFLPGGQTYSRVTAVAGDGGVIIGSAQVSPTSFRDYRWTPTTGMAPMPPPPPNYSPVSVSDVSNDGRTIVGHASWGWIAEPFTWTAETGYRLLGVPPGAEDSLGVAVSADGSVVAGRLVRHPAYGDVPMRWTQETGTAALELPSNWRDSHGSWDAVNYSLHLSDDGSVLTGHSGYDGVDGGHVIHYPYGVFRWTPDSGYTIRPGMWTFRDASATGDYVVGRCFTPAGAPGRTGDIYYECIWDEANQGRSIRDILSEQVGLDFAVWGSPSLGGISGDARAVCGSMYNPDGNYEAFLLRLPLPGDMYADGNGDLRVDAEDAKPFGNCMKGPGVAVGNVCRAAADLDFDGDVDLRDFVKRLQPLAADPCEMADISGDCVVDEHDAAAFVACLTGPFEQALSPGIPASCSRADLNGDDAVDLRDFAALQLLFAGTEVPMECDPPVAMDLDGDCAVSDSDLAAFAECMIGPDAPTPCPAADPDLDGDTDLGDFATLQRLFPVDDGDGG